MKIAFALCLLSTAAHLALAAPATGAPTVPAASAAADPATPPAAAAATVPAPTEPAAAAAAPAAPASGAAATPPLAAASAAAPVEPIYIVVRPAVLQGDADCDLKDRVSLRELPGSPGTYEVRHRKARYVMTSEETTTGAVRLRDAKADFVWLQIPTKSMLLNAKIGQRVADGCRVPEQRAEEIRQQQAAAALAAGTVSASASSTGASGAAGAVSAASAGAPPPARLGIAVTTR